MRGPGQDAPVNNARFRATELIGAVQHTDTTIMERLMVERVTPLTTADMPEYQRLFEFYDALLSDAAISQDALYLLISHIHNVGQVLRAADPADPAMTAELMNQVRRPLHALCREAMTAARCRRALVQLAEEAARVDTSLMADPTTATQELRSSAASRGGRPS